MKQGSLFGIVLFMMLCLPSSAATVEDDLLKALPETRPYHLVTAVQFEQLGWDLPDGGSSVRALADAAQGGAFDPRKLEALPPAKLGYRAKWHEVRFTVYGLGWDITGLQLIPEHPLPGMPTVVIIHGGLANWYEFFVDPLNEPALAQYLAQRVPVMLVTYPGNYRHGGWTGNQYNRRTPAYVLDRDISPEEARVRNASYTYRVIRDGVLKLLETTTTGPLVIVGHSTGGEIRFLLENSSLQARLHGLALGWGSGGPSSLETMKSYRARTGRGSHPPLGELLGGGPQGYVNSGYVGALNPLREPGRSDLEVAERWFDREARRRPQFEQPTILLEHRGLEEFRDELATEVRQALAGNRFGVDPNLVTADLFLNLKVPLSGYRKMIWTVSRHDLDHWGPDPKKAREAGVSEEFLRRNPGAAVRVLVFDSGMTHYGHFEKPRQLAGGLLVALQWLVSP